MFDLTYLKIKYSYKAVINNGSTVIDKKRKNRKINFDGKIWGIPI